MVVCLLEVRIIRHRWQVTVRRSVASRGTCEGNAQVGEVLLTSHEKMAQDWANVLLKHAQA